MYVYYAVDIGGTKTCMGLVYENGQIIDKNQVPTPKNPEETVEFLVNMLKEWQKKHDVEADAIGIGAPNIKGGNGGGKFMSTVVNIKGWENFDLRKSLENKLGNSVPIGIENDADAASMGAFLFDMPEKDLKEKLPFLYFTLGTGVGGALILGDSNGGWILNRGYDGEHPEFTHFPFSSDNGIKVMCGCGRDDCFESFVGGRSIIHRYGKKAEVLDYEGKKSIAKNLARGVYSIALHYGPRYISFGGSIPSGWGDEFLNMLIEEISVYYSLSGLMKQPEIVLSGMRSDTGLLGAAAVAIKAHDDAVGFK